MKKIILGYAIIVIIVCFLVLAVNILQNKNSGKIACTQEAKICPGGSAVGRSGPKCEFAPCPKLNNTLAEAEAREIAKNNCIKGGESLAPGIYNTQTKTWWFDANLNSAPEGCSPACVVSEDTKKAEINWRCTGYK